MANLNRIRIFRNSTVLWVYCIIGRTIYGQYFHFLLLEITMKNRFSFWIPNQLPFLCIWSTEKVNRVIFKYIFDKRIYG